MKKNLENFHEILSVSKHSHSEVGFILVISLGPEGVGSFADRKGVRGHRPPAGGGGRRPPAGGVSAACRGRGASAARAGGGALTARRGGALGSEAPPVLPTLSLGRLMKRNNYQNGQGDCLMGVSQGTVFGRGQTRIWSPEIF